MLSPVSSGLARGRTQSHKGRDKVDSTEANQAADMASCELATFGSQEIGVNDSLIFGLGLSVEAVVGCRLVQHP
jgi:hypothetical protein